MSNKIKVLFVCMGNICRSPTAHGVFQAMVDEQGLGDIIVVESAGTHGFHIGNPPDLRSQEVARRHELDLSGLRARQFLAGDFNDFDFIIGMDKANISDMISIKPDAYTATVSLLLDYSEKYSLLEVPDPYYDNDGFNLVFDMVSDASAGLLRHIRQRHAL
ncbi:MAG: low molecular weight phosphotyrosine protein phosphatase [Gammaproteobacteria bacterium]|nr:low molecular weight phosphotyrosine protein phosphatase [Gammaproteobacteria bacterium]